MQNQPMQIDKKEFQELLKEIKQYNKLDLVAQTIQTKYASEMAGEDHEQRLKAQQDSNDLLKKIYDAILKSGNQTAKVADKVDKLAKETKDYKPVSEIKDKRPTTVKEDLKSFVAGTKKLGSGIKSAVTGLMEPKRTPSGDIEAASGFLEKVGKAGKDILSTSEDYTVEGGRFAEVYSRTAEGTRFQKGGKGSLDVGLEKFNELKAKEEEIKKVQQKIDEQKKYGFEPNKGDVEKLKTLKSEYAEADIRQKPASAKEKIEAQGKAENPNVVDEPQEVVAEESKKQSVTFKELLDTTKESLDQLKAIRASLEGTQVSQPGTPAAKPAAAAAPVEAAGEGGGGFSPLDLLGRGGAAAGAGGAAGGAAAGKAAGGAAAGKAGAAGAAKAGFGAKALGALKAGGAMLGKGAIVAGKAVAGAALAKPALIAAGVGLAAYGAYKGYQALTSEDEEQPAEGKNPFVEQAKKSREAQALKKLNEEGKYTFEPKGRTVFVYDKESGKLVRSIAAPKEITGAELMQAAEIGSQAQQPAPTKPIQSSTEPSTDSQEPILSPYETMGQPPSTKKEKSAVIVTPTAPEKEIKPQRQASIGDAIARQEGKTSRSLEARVDKKEEEQKQQPQRQASIGDAIARQEARTARSVQGRQPTTSAAPIQPSPVEEPAPKKTMGQRLASFFGFGKKEEEQKQQPQRQAGIGDAIARQEARTARSLEARKAGKKPDQPSSVTPITTAPPQAAAQTTSTLTGVIDAQIAEKKQELNYHAGRSSPKSLEKVKVLNRELADLEAKKMRQQDRSAQVQPAAPSTTPSKVASTTAENQTIRDETAAQGRGGQPVVMNNVSNNNTTTYVPVKGEPRPGSRGSALDRYHDRVAAY